MRQKIASMEIGKTYETTLIVKSALARETRAKKPFLSLELYDGTDTINANYWSWSTGNMPSVNTILDIKAHVTAWLGAKQLDIKSMSTNTSLFIADFAPTSIVDIASTYKAAYAMMSSVKDDTLRTLAVSALEELHELWCTVPGAVSIHHAYIGGTLIHSYSVACIAGNIAKSIPEASYDLVVVGAMLHDIGKLFTYKLNGVVIDMTSEGRLLEHIFMGAEFIGNFAESHVDTNIPSIAAKVRLLRHIILSHHGKLEYGSPVTPQSIEAYIVNCADGIDAVTEQVMAASHKATTDMWTDRIYTLSNRPHIRVEYTKEVLAE